MLSLKMAFFAAKHRDEYVTLVVSKRNSKNVPISKNVRCTGRPKDFKSKKALCFLFIISQKFCTFVA